MTRNLQVPNDDKRVLRVQYSATTNRMLRVAVNGFFESLGVVIHCMEELDIDVIGNPVKEPLVAVQGLEESRLQNWKLWSIDANLQFSYAIFECVI